MMFFITTQHSIQTAQAYVLRNAECGTGQAPRNWGKLWVEAFTRAARLAGL
jgi:hypothetical protein